MKVTNYVARMLCGELYGVGDNTSTWGEDDAAFTGINLELVQEDLIDTTRWSHVHERIYKDLNTGKFYSTSYSSGATECQDERPYEYDGDVIEFTEVEPVQVTVTQYRPVEV